MHASNALVSLWVQVFVCASGSGSEGLTRRVSHISCPACERWGAGCQATRVLRLPLPVGGWRISQQRACRVCMFSVRWQIRRSSAHGTGLSEAWVERIRLGITMREYWSPLNVYLTYWSKYGMARVPHRENLAAVHRGPLEPSIRCSCAATVIIHAQG